MFQKNKFILILALFVLLFTTACQLLGAPVAVIPTPAVTTPIIVLPTVDTVTTLEPTAGPTTAVPTPTNQPPATVPAGPSQPTAVAVLDTTVQYIIALGDVNIRSGPSMDYQIVSSLRKNQTAVVTGISSDNGWWKIQCPSGITGSCWTTANTQYTKPTTAPSNQPPPTPASAACTDSASFVTDVSVPDNTRYQPDAFFTKTWRIKNTGTCTWDKNYAIAFKDGHRIGSAYEAYALTGTVAPNGTVDISIKMQAPPTAGSYQGNWQLRNPKNGRFGVGQSNTPLWVKIIVDGPTTGKANLGGTAFQDFNLNSVMENNELLANAKILLFTGNNCSQFITHTFTDNTGRYNFGGLNAGSYCIIGEENNAYVVQTNVTIGADTSLNNNNLSWPFVGPQTGVISGRVYQDKNNNGSFDSGDVTVGPGREIWLQRNSCDNAGALVVQAITREDGQYAFHEAEAGTYCVGLRSNTGMEDVKTVTLAARQIVDNVNLRTAPFASIAGWFWLDHCFARTDGNGTNVIEGNCVPNGTGGYRANGIPDAGEIGLSNVTVLIQLGTCSADNNNVLVSTSTDSNGQYMFRDLNSGTYCIQVKATEGTNKDLLLPGEFTAPAPAIWYSQITIYAGEQRTGVNFAWDYQFS